MKFYIPAIIWGAIILILCVTPGSSIPTFDWADLFSVDKLAHAFFYFVLVLLIIWGDYKNGKKSRLFSVTCLCILYGISIEFVQKYFCVDRYFEVLDMIANSIGALVAFSIIYFKIGTKYFNSIKRQQNA